MTESYDALLRAIEGAADGGSMSFKELRENNSSIIPYNISESLRLARGAREEGLIVLEEEGDEVGLTDLGRARLEEIRVEQEKRDAEWEAQKAWDYAGPGTSRLVDGVIEVKTEGRTKRWDLEPDGNAFPRLGALNILPAEWQVDSLWHEGALVLLYGVPDSFKTFLALDWANCVSRGVPWNGLATRQAPVVYVLAEGASLFGVRQDAWVSEHGADPADNPFAHPAPVDLLGKATFKSVIGANELIALLQHATPERAAGLVVIDTLHRCMAGGSDVSDKDMGRVIEVATRITKEVGCTVLLIHHAGWAAIHERGSNALRGACDSVFQAKTVSGRLTLTNEKQKDAGKAETRVLETREVGGSLVLDLASEVVAGSTLRTASKVRDVLAAAEEGTALTHGQVRTETGLGKATVTKYLAALVDAGEATKDDEGGYRLVQT